ncbi:MAG: CBS domain-containing protein [Methanomicrobiales archaeon]
MTTEVITTKPEDSVVDALNKITINNIGRLPVVKDHELVGIISKTDIVRVLEILSKKKD